MPEDQEGPRTQEEPDFIPEGQPEEARLASRPRVLESARPDVPPTPPNYLLTSKTEFHGPLPPPDYLRTYNDVIPGAAERLLAEAEKNAEHRRWRERTALQAQVSRIKWGLASGFSVAMSFLAVSGYLIAHGHDVSGTILGTVDLVALVGVFAARQSQADSRRKEAPAPEKKEAKTRLEVAADPDKPE